MGNQPPTANGPSGGDSNHPGNNREHGHPQSQQGHHQHHVPNQPAYVSNSTNKQYGHHQPHVLSSAPNSNVHGQGQAQHQSHHSNHAHSMPLSREKSDSSMFNADDAKGDGDGNNNRAPVPVPVGEISSLQMDIASLTSAEDDTVPTVFRWEHGGRQVYITGTFNGWSRQIPMHRSGNDFSYIHNLKRGKHAFKFIVDDEWRFAPDQPTVADVEGRINNFIDVSDFKAYVGDKDFERERSAAEYGGGGTRIPSDKNSGGNAVADGGAIDLSNREGGGGSSGGIGSTGGAATTAATVGGKDRPHPRDPDGETFGHTVPDIDEYTKEPPPLPPHLRHIILNKPPQLQDTAALPVPQHVALNHLYCTAIKDNMMVLGITQRFRTKFVTTVYYSPCS